MSKRMNRWTDEWIDNKNMEPILGAADRNFGPLATVAKGPHVMSIL